MFASISFRGVTLAKVGLAVLLIGSIFAIAGRSMFPAVPLAAVLAYAAGAMLALVALVSIVFFLGASLNQVVVRAGGTDTQWLWFKSEPPGLVNLRRRAGSPPSDEA